MTLTKLARRRQQRDGITDAGDTISYTFTEKNTAT